MHIGIAGRIAYPFTGSELVMLRLLQELVCQDRQNRYTLFLNDCAADPGFSASNLHIVRYGRAWQPPIPNILWHQCVLPWLIASHKIDVLFVPHNRLPVIRNCRQVVLLHDLAEFRVSHKYDRARSLYRKSLLRVGLKKADWVVTGSESSKVDIQHYGGIPGARITTIYYAVDADFHPRPASEAAAQLRRKFGLTEPFMLYVGALDHPNKNLLPVLAAYHAARARQGLQHQLVLVGPRRRQSEVIFKAIERLELCGAVVWLGYVPLPDLHNLYAAADLFVFMSLWEGFGLPVLEALASGTPVLASCTGALPEVVGQAGVLVDPTNVEAITNAMCQLLGDRAARQHYSELGLVQARRFSWEASARRLGMVLHQAAAP